MKLTRGERWALLFYGLVVAGFMPPAIVWANRVEPYVGGVPFLVAWVGAMTLLSSVLMSLALVLKRRLDRDRG